MGLRDKLRPATGQTSTADIERNRFQHFGIVENPFPSASQTQGHPHMWTDTDDRITDFVRDYDHNVSTKVLVIEGDQGTGKTNLLNYYESQFREVYQDHRAYIIRYYADPEPGFDKMLARILEELGTDFLKTLARSFSKLDETKRNEIAVIIKMSDIRTILRGLCSAAEKSEAELESAAEAALNWLLGAQVFKRHRDALGDIHFRLDTIESKTLALRDLIYCSAAMGNLKGLILLLDELEKTDSTTSKLAVLRFLTAIRALIDALPQYLFLMAAMTPEARRRYFEMLPAFAGRLQNRIELTYLKDPDSATELFNFYLNEAKSKATSKFGQDPNRTDSPVITNDEAIGLFEKLLQSAQKRGDEGVRQRDYLNTLHLVAAEKMRALN